MTNENFLKTDSKPGGYLAVKYGCLCNPKENGFGCGYKIDSSGGPGVEGKPLYFVNNLCPLHGEINEKVFSK